jgi:hypothetical protein
VASKACSRYKIIDCLCAMSSFFGANTNLGLLLLSLWMHLGYLIWKKGLGLFVATTSSSWACTVHGPGERACARSARGAYAVAVSYSGGGPDSDPQLASGYQCLLRLLMERFTQIGRQRKISCRTLFSETCQSSVSASALIPGSENDKICTMTGTTEQRPAQCLIRTSRTTKRS